MAVSAGILVGGASRRMGRPKALIEVDGVTLLERTIGIAASVADRVVLLGHPPFDLPALAAHLPIVDDRHPGVGPIGGLDAMLAAHAGQTCLLLACDMPHLEADLLLRLAAAGEDVDAAVCRTLVGENGWHPCCGLYRPSAAAYVEQAIGESEYGMMHLLKRLRVQAVDLRGEEARWVSNWNAPVDRA